LLGKDAVNRFLRAPAALYEVHHAGMQVIGCGVFWAGACFYILCFCAGFWSLSKPHKRHYERFFEVVGKSSRLTFKHTAPKTWVLT
jgi:hypothetical protein